MPSANIIMWIGRRLEKKVMNLSCTHAEKVCTVIKLLEDVVKAFFSKDIDSLLNSNGRLIMIEKEADDLKRKIIHEISRGSFHPIDSEVLLRLVFATDDVATRAKIASSRTALLPQAAEGVPDYLKNAFLQVVSLLVEQAKIMVEAMRLLGKKPKNAIGVCDRIEMLEEEIDGVHISLTKDLLESSSELGLTKFMLLKELADDLEEIADRCEDVADIIRSLAVSMT